MSDVIEIDDKLAVPVLDYFDKVGFKLDEKDWFEAYSEPINSGLNENEYQETIYHELAYAPAGNPNKITRNSNFPEKMFRLVYRYSQNLQHNSRIFCQKMVAKSQSGTLYTVEDIRSATNKAVNKGLGRGGSNTYSIWFFQGGANCKHWFDRVWYYRKKVPKGYTIVGNDGKEYKGGEFLPDGTLKQFKKVSESFAKRMGVRPKVSDTMATSRKTWKKEGDKYQIISYKKHY